MKLEIVLLILFVHWIADFVLQTDEMAKGKATSNKWLSLHVATYAATFAILSVFILPTTIGMLWAITNAVIHWIQDYFTSRINKTLKENGNNHGFFISIGADQYLHYAFLLGTYVIALRYA